MNEEAKPEASIDKENLYREENFTDLKVGTIQRLTPVKPDGSVDLERVPLFSIQTSLMTQMGPLPVQTGVEAATLEEVIEKFPEAVQQAVERMVEEAQTRQRDEASRIVTPGEMMQGGPGGGQNPLISPDGGFHG